MRNNRKKLNHSIMMGVMAMGVLVLLVILLFWYMMLGGQNPAETLPAE